jgi:hypothetical protein
LRPLSSRPCPRRTGAHTVDERNDLDLFIPSVRIWLCVSCATKWMHHRRSVTTRAAGRATHDTYHAVIGSSTSFTGLSVNTWGVTGENF